MQTPCGHQSKEKVDARFLCVDSGFCGQVQFVKDTRRLYRTGLLPRLGVDAQAAAVGGAQVTPLNLSCLQRCWSTMSGRPK